MRKSHLFRNLRQCLFIFFCLLCLISFLGTQSQANPLVRGNVTSQYYLPAPQVATINDAWAMLVNPAGVAFIEGAQFVGGYEHEWRKTSNLHRALGVFVFQLLPRTSVAFGGDLVIPANPFSNSNEDGMLAGRVGAATRLGKHFALGLSVYKSKQLDQRFGDPVLFSLGTQMQPASFFAVGITVSQVFPKMLLPLAALFGISVMPLGKRIIFGANALILPVSGNTTSGFRIDPSFCVKLNLGTMALAASLRTQNIRQGFLRPIATVGIELNSNHFGAAFVAQGVSVDRASIGAHIRMSSEPQPLI